MNSGRAGDDDVLVLPPLPADPLFVDAVDEAIAGPVDDLPDAQPERTLGENARDFASLYIRHRASFGLHARRFLHDPRDVDEVLQEAFLRLFLAMPELETELQALAYCRRTVTNLCIDRYRADQRRPRLIDLDTIDWDPSDQASYDDPVLRAEDAAIVRQALSLLSPMHRAALVKREIEEKPLPQIASELGVPEESVKHLLYRARRALRRLLVGTSVEPGADLSNSQLMRLANERLARATLRSANVLIVLFVAAVTVVGAIRVGARDQARRVGDVGSVATPQSGGGVPSTGAHPVSPTHPKSAKPSHSAHKSHTTTSVAPTPPASTSTPASPPPVATPHSHDHWQSRPTKPTPPSGNGSSGNNSGQQTGGGNPSSGGPAYSLTGDLTATTQPQVTDQQVLPASDSQLLFSRFVATTSQGDFAVKQIVTQQDDAAPNVSLKVSLPVDGASVTTATLGYTTTVQPNADGTQTVTGTVDVVPVSQTIDAAIPPSANDATSVTVAFTVNPAGGTVTGETVHVENPPAAVSVPDVVGNLPMSPSTPAGTSAPALSLQAAERSGREVINNFAVAGRPAAQTGV